MKMEVTFGSTEMSVLPLGTECFLPFVVRDSEFCFVIVCCFVFLIECLKENLTDDKYYATCGYATLSRWTERQCQ